MNLFLQMLNLQFAMFILIIIGIIAKRCKIINFPDTYSNYHVDFWVNSIYWQKNR